MRKIAGTVSLLCFCLFSFSQTSKNDDSLTMSVEKYLAAINKKSNQAEEFISSKSLKYIKKLKKSEQSLQHILEKKDSLLALQLFGGIEKQYNSMQDGFKGVTKNLQFPHFSNQLIETSTNIRTKSQKYLPFLDTLKTSLKFLKLNGKILSGSRVKINEYEKVITKLNNLEHQIQQAEDIKEFINRRKDVLSKISNKYGLEKVFIKYRKQAYYYAKEIQDFKMIINNPDKVLQKSVGLIAKMPFFKEFMQSNSELAKLFPIGNQSSISNINGSLQISGLQTKMQTQTTIQSQLGGTASNSQQIIQQAVQAARSQLEALKHKITQAGGGSSDLELPVGFKAKDQKTKSFWSRLELGTNFQTKRANMYWPIETELGISIGYKCSERLIVGIGAASIIGWGKDISHITISNNGANLRSFIDWKVKSGFYVSGGIEYRYIKVDEAFSSLMEYDNWQKSALLGVKKKYSLGKKWKGDISLLYNILWQQQIPVAQPVSFRLGYFF